MRFIKQILIILGVTFLGELLHDWIPLPVRGEHLRAGADVPVLAFSYFPAVGGAGNG